MSELDVIDVSCPSCRHTQTMTVRQHGNYFVFDKVRFCPECNSNLIDAMLEAGKVYVSGSFTFERQLILVGGES